MKVLFWNTYHNKNINSILCELIHENSISFVILAEYIADIDSLRKLLREKGIYMQQFPTLGCDRITVLGVEMPIVPGTQTDYSSFQIINNRDIYCCVHLPSKIYKSNQSTRNVTIKTIIEDIESTEKELNSDNTIIVGDFNINPFDAGCLDALSFHGIPIYEAAKKEKRTIAGKEFKMFYNPMWRFFGDEKKPFGTYYFSSNDTSTTFWNIYDQVIIRPSLQSRFISSSLQIVTDTQTQCLLNKQGHPDKKISDHLPIVFEIEEDN